MKKGTMKKSVSILLALLLILSLQLAHIAVFAEADSDSYIEEVVRLVNIERANEGLSELTIMEDLCNAAQVRAEEIVELLYPCASGWKQIGVRYLMNMEFHIVLRAENLCSWDLRHRLRLWRHGCLHPGIEAIF